MSRVSSASGSRQRRVVCRRRRKAGAPSPVQPALPRKASVPRFRFVTYPDGSRRPERFMTREEGLKKQAESDFYGVPVPLSTGANVRDAASILTELLSHIDLHDDDFSPEFLASVWHRTVGDFLASQSTLISLSDGCATIRAPHPTVCFELRQQHVRLIAALNASFGEDCVQSVRILPR